MRLARFLGRYLRHYLGWLALAVAAAGLFAVATMTVAALIEPVFREVLLAGESADELMGGAESAAPLLPGGGDAANFKAWLDRAWNELKERLGVDQNRVVLFLPLVFVCVFLVRSAADFVSGYSFNRIGLGITTDIRNDLYRRVIGQSARFHALHPSGELMSRIVNDVALMQTAVSTRVMDLVQQSLTLVGLLYLLFNLDAELALVCVVVLPAILFPIVRFGRGMRRTSHQSQERMADLANLVGEGVRGHRVVKAFGMEEFEWGRFRQATARHLKVNLRAQVLANLSSPVVESLGVFGGAALLYYAGSQIRANELSPSLFIAFLATLFWMYEPVRKLNKANLVLQQSLAAARRLLDIMSLPNEIRDRPGASRVESVEREIRFRDVTFAYAGDEPVLQGIDLRIERGEVVALVGPSGAGKTTLVNLLPRFFDPDEGGVEIDGVDLRDLQLSSLRGLIGLVTQETTLFNDSIRANIAYGRSEVALDRIREAAQAAYADDFILALPEGYETVIGEAGLRLSGGQRQRLAIARALLKDPPILILDEATSQLDTESEAVVQKALSNLMQGRTTLVIAHRLSTVQRADRIVVMDAGRVVEQGRHEALLEAGGLYRRLYDLQFRD